MKQNQPPLLTPEQSAKRRKVLYFVMLVTNTILIFGLYRVLIDLGYFQAIFIVYAILCTGFILGYLIYNRGLSRKELTPDMLPATWSAEQKCAFLEDGKRRLDRSKWMLTVIVPFLLTFAFDAVELFVWDYVKQIFSFS